MTNVPQTIDDIKTAIQSAGIVGAGGGGFPSHLKIDPRAKTILLNCAECEPLIQVDQQLLANFTVEILSALHLLAEVLDATAVVAVKKSYTAAIQAVERELRRGDPCGHPQTTDAICGQAQGQPLRIKLVTLDETYPAGDEVVLIYEALGIAVPPGGLPIDIGCIVFNVETVLNMYHAFWHDKAVTHKWLTIIGEVKRPATVCVPIDMPIAEAVEKYSVDPKIGSTEMSFIVGGPMMGRLAASTDKITKTTKAILVLPPDHMLVRKHNSNNSANLNRVASACCQCRTCTDMCPRNLLGHPIEPHRIMRAIAARDAKSAAFTGAMYCSQCGLCEAMACPQSLAPRSLIKEVKTALGKEGVRAEKCEAREVAFSREGRMVSAKRLKMRLGLTKYDVEAPILLEV